MASLFNDALDGLTFKSLQDVDEYHESLSILEAENGWLRAAENNYFSPREGGYEEGLLALPF